jgi:hypothetical protein
MPSYFERDAPKGYTDGLLRFLKLPLSDESYRRFGGLTPRSLAAILKAAPHLAGQTQNDSPSMAEFADLGKRYPAMRFHGYIIGPERNDERISIEGWDAPNTLDICVAEGLTPDEATPSHTWWD